MDELQRQLKAFSKRYGFQGQMMKARIEILMKQGKSPEDAVRQVFREFGVEDWLQVNVAQVIVGTAQDALGKEAASTLSTAAILEALSNPWDGSGLTLSEKIHGASNVMLNDVISTLQEQIRRNKTVKDTAQALYDGYKSGHVVREQQLPQYLDELTRWTRRSRENLSQEELKDLQRAIRKVKYQADDLVDDRATYNHFRTSLREVMDKLEHGSEKAAQRALQNAIQEKSRYVAERIARTEGARARYDAFMARNGEDEDVVAYKWKLGSRHPAEDICDMYANADLYGLGKGIFPKDKVVPQPAHPHCLCHYAPVYWGEIDEKKRSDNVEENGRAWLAKQPLHIRQAILGVKGEKEWRVGRAGWMEKARNISPVFEKKESRLEKLILQLHSKKLIVIVRPNAFDDSRKVVIPEGKLVNYCLNKNHPDGGPKAVAFEKYLGYTQSDSKKLENLIRNNLGKAKYYDRGNNGYGNQYSAVFKTSSLDGKEIPLITGWIIKKGEKYPKMTTAYLKPELKVMQL
ncbi:DUF6883 domain-containing protein [Acidaminococcus timonensis]|uniref:DUF6883 domain-containing protein n=1 Tax=Acidaminococcus timonensis TaxID=1871002 RepID=UPI0029431543|nr:DUF6883 domain-containing protein [Acidaminococcus timonensis]